MRERRQVRVISEKCCGGWGKLGYFWKVHDSLLAAASAMAWRGVAGSPCCGSTFWTSRTKAGKKALRFLGLALRTPDTFIVLVDLLHHFERFLALSASVLINRHIRRLLLLSTNVYKISDRRQKRNRGTAGGAICTPYRPRCSGQTLSVTSLIGPTCAHYEPSSYSLPSQIKCGK